MSIRSVYPEYSGLNKKITTFILGLVLMAGSLHAQMFWNQAAKFENGSYIACPNTLSLNIVGSLTAEAWVYPTVNSGTRYIVFKGNASNGYYLRLNSNGTVSLGTNGITRITSTAVIPAGKWSHVAGSYDVSNNGYKLFVNGLEDASIINIINSAPNTNTDSLFIGKFGANTFTGLIDEVRIWTKAVSPNMVRRSFRTSLTVSNGQYVSLLFSMPFQRINSTGTLFTIQDLSLNPISVNPTYNRGVTAVDLSNRPSDYLNGNEALQFEGSNFSYAAIPNNALNDITGAVTMEAWIFSEGPSPENKYIIHKRGGGGFGYRLMLSNTQKISYTVNNSQFYESSASLYDFRWYHIAWVISAAGSSSLYINGELDSYQSAAGTPQSNNDSMYIGRGFNGMIDEVRMFRFERTQTEIKKYLTTPMDASNAPAGVGYVFNFDGSAWANHGIQYYFLRGSTTFSAPAAINSGTSPLIRADNMNFQEGFYKTIDHRRIPESGTMGAMIDDSITIPDNVNITDLNVFISLNHGGVNELDIRLIGPGGQQVLLMDNFDFLGAQSNLTTIFDDNADTSLITGRYVHVSPRVKPTAGINSVFNGTNSSGIWRLRINDASGVNGGILMTWGIQINNSPVIGIQNISGEVPGRFSLGQNYPNPFNPKTNFRIQLPKGSFVKLTVFDITGKKVAVLVNEELNAGTYNVDFDASHLASGTYFYKLETNGFSDVKKMILIK